MTCSIFTILYLPNFLFFLNTDNYESTFMQTIRTLPAMREINEMHAILLDKMKMDMPDLHTEVFPPSSSESKPG